MMLRFLVCFINLCGVPLFDSGSSRLFMAVASLVLPGERKGSVIFVFIRYCVSVVILNKV